jgi:hypothetical protein
VLKLSDVAGKMFKCVELPWLVQFFLMFYNDKPVDWLLDHMIHTKTCSLDMDSVSCAYIVHSLTTYWTLSQDPELWLFISEKLQESQVTALDSLQTVTLPTCWDSLIPEREGSETKGMCAIFICD